MLRLLIYTICSYDLYRNKTMLISFGSTAVSACFQVSCQIGKTDQILDFLGHFLISCNL